MTKAPVSIGAEIVVEKLTGDEKRAISDLLSYPNPDFERLTKLGKYTGHVDPRVRSCRVERGGALVVPRGAFHLVRRKLIELGREPEIVPATVHVPLRELVPFLDADAPGGHTPRPYQLEAEERLLRQVQGYVVLPCGCLSGDTELVVNRAGKSFRTTIREVARIASGINVGAGRKLDPGIETRTQAVDADGRRRLDTIEAAFSTGIKTTFSLTTESGRVIRATADHLFQTPNGWRKLSQLSPGDEVHAVRTAVGTRATGAPHKKISYPRTAGVFMANHPFATTYQPSRPGHSATGNVATHRLVAEARLNGIDLGTMIERIKANNLAGMEFLDPKVWVVHHIDRDPGNYDPSNLEVLSHEQHLAEHGHEEGRRNCNPSVEIDRVASIVLYGEEETFDLTMRAEEHNYIANGFVVHNSGKTFVGSRAMVRSGQAGLVLCHTGDLLDQWRDAIYLASGTPPRLVGDDHGGDLRPARPREIVAALIQSVQSAGAAAAPFLRSFGAVLIDEAHRAPTAGYVDLLSRCPARYRWGLTATPDRSDGLGFLLGWHIGPELYRLTPRDLAAAGYLRLPCSMLVRSGWAAGDDVRDRTGRLEWHKVVASFSTDPTRDATICDLAAACVESGRTTLVLVHRVDHAGRIAIALRKRGITAEAVTGQTDRGHRKRRMNDARKGRVDCLVATQLADEGLDIPNLAALVMAAPQRAEGRALQRLGRLTRPGGDKLAPVAFDLVDGGLEHQARARAAAYAREYDADPGRSVDLPRALAFLRSMDAGLGDPISVSL